METPKEFALLLTEVADRAYLTTLNREGYPSTRAMLNLRNPSLYPSLADLFAAHRDDFLVYFTTNTSSGKVREIQRNSRGCVYYCHPKRWRGIALLGNLEVTRDADIRRVLWQDAWTIYYPGGVDDPDYSVIRFRPREIRGWNGHEALAFGVGVA